jgi:hypothetical protein
MEKNIYSPQLIDQTETADSRCLAFDDFEKFGGARRNRTDDLFNAMVPKVLDLESVSYDYSDTILRPPFRGNRCE